MKLIECVVIAKITGKLQKMRQMKEAVGEGKNIKRTTYP